MDSTSQPSNIPEGAADGRVDMQSTPAQKQMNDSAEGRHRKESFPAKLFRILEEVEEKGLTQIISWMPQYVYDFTLRRMICFLFCRPLTNLSLGPTCSGRAFRVHDRKLFVELVMPR